MSNARPETTRTRAVRVAGWLAVAAAYFVLGQLSFRSATVHPVVASVWPPAGLALALFVAPVLLDVPTTLLFEICATTGFRCWASWCAHSC